MKTQIAPFAAPQTPAAVVGAIAEYAKQNKPQVGGGLPFLRLLGADGWVYGAEDNEVEDDSRWAVNVGTVMKGWVAWTDDEDTKNEKVGEVMVDMATDMPPKGELDEVEAEWRKAYYMEMVCIHGEDKGTTVQYSANSQGANQFCEKLFQDIGKQYVLKPDECVPILTLSSSHYQHKKWGRTYKPEYTVYGWAKYGDTKITKVKPKAKAKAKKAA